MTYMSTGAEEIVYFHNGRETAEQWIREIGTVIFNGWM